MRCKEHDYVILVICKMIIRNVLYQIIMCIDEISYVGG
jgi:hypothetical protein